MLQQQQRQPQKNINNKVDELNVGIWYGQSQSNNYRYKMSLLEFRFTLTRRENTAKIS